MIDFFLLVHHSFDNKNPKFAHHEKKIRRVISEATKVWADNSVLKFREVFQKSHADIVVSFEDDFHDDLFPFSGGILAHAFPPTSGLGGDIHIRESEEWDFDVMFGEKPADKKTSLFATVLHEMGHSLGLHHSADKTAVMYHSIHASTGVLSQDDFDGIQFIYGASKERPKFKQLVPTIQTTTAAPSVIPDKCNTSFDAAAYIHSESFLFKGEYFWRPELKTKQGRENFKISEMWKGLPENLTHVDAVYGNDDVREVWFFIGRKIFVFAATKFKYTLSLRDLGIDERRYSKIDAIFKWHRTGRTYVFSGNDYWRLEGKRVSKDYPKAIASAWRDVYDFDTAFADGGKLYFLIDTHLFEFDSRTMRIDRMKPQSVGSKFMGCPGEKKQMLRNRFSEDNSDVIWNWKPDEIPEDKDNIEKSCAGHGKIFDLLFLPFDVPFFMSLTLGPSR